MLKSDYGGFWVKNLGLPILGKFGQMVPVGIGFSDFFGLQLLKMCFVYITENLATLPLDFGFG